MTTMQKTTVGLNYIRDSWIGANSSDGLMLYMSLGTGAAVTTSALNSGTPYTAIAVASLPAAIAPNQTLTLLDSAGDVQAVTVSAAGASLHATSIPTVSFTPSATFAIGSGLVNTPAASDTALETEIFRNSISSGVAGGTGEGVIVMFVGSTDVGASYNFLEMGLWAGPSASLTLGSGVLIGRAAVWYAYTAGVSADNLEFDLTIS